MVTIKTTYTCSICHRKYPTMDEATTCEAKGFPAQLYEMGNKFQSIDRLSLAFVLLEGATCEITETPKLYGAKIKGVTQHRWGYKIKVSRKGSTKTFSVAVSQVQLQSLVDRGSFKPIS